jgi:hypothetical protein
MSKIDEVIEECDRHGRWTGGGLGVWEYRYDMVHKGYIIEQLKLLRPYVELAELFADKERYLLKHDWHGAEVDKFLELNAKARLLIKQIKEGK